MANKIDAFGSVSSLSTAAGEFKINRLDVLEKQGLCDLDKLPFSIKVLLEAALRNVDNFVVNETDVKRLAGWDPKKPANNEVPFNVARVILQDFTGVPCVV